MEDINAPLIVGYTVLILLMPINKIGILKRSTFYILRYIQDHKIYTDVFVVVIVYSVMLNCCNVSYLL